jgi:hypothetical protein
VYAGIFDENAELATAVRVSEFEEDRAGARLVGVFSAGHGSLARLLREGHLGLVPQAAGVAPEAAIVEVSPDRFVLSERGNVRVLDEAPAGAARLLRAIGAGDGAQRVFRGKEQLVAEVWGISRYRHDRHDPIVHTAVSRLRALLGTSGHWVESHNGTYRLSPEVAFLALGGSSIPASPAPSASPAPPEAAEGEPAARERALLLHLGQGGSCSTADVASALKVSEMTAFRTIRALLDRGLLTRTGKGRGTRYTVVDLGKERGR